MPHTTDNPPAGPEMDAAVAAFMEMPFPITARAARASVRDFQWVSCHDIYSPGGWWRAEIGTDHGPPEDDDKPVRWRPAREPSTDPAADYEVLKHVREKYADGTGRAMEWAAFLTALNAVYQPRRRQDYKAFELAIHCDHYQPGDYSRAVLAAAAGKEKA